MNQYTYFALGIVLGISLAVYYFMNREEKIEKRIVLDQQIYSTPKLDKTMENVVDKINLKIKEFKRELTEEEKNEIIKISIPNHIVIILSLFSFFIRYYRQT